MMMMMMMMMMMTMMTMFDKDRCLSLKGQAETHAIQGFNTKL